jgi:MoxR-like ATPase
VNAPAAKPAEATFTESATSFRKFFSELREAFLEREWLFTQVELALLSREHVLIIGPPGTAKSAIAGAVLGRITDQVNNKPSLFSKQLAENTVQTDLIGPVDFKVLTETGRTEYLTEEGMLGAVHAFLDEVFDGRDMLLRSILNVLHERELKHGRKVTPGRCECAVMTSNRYLSEVMARSPETLQAFADRISFICFTPKSFARRSSRAQMLSRAQSGERPVLHEKLTLQQLDCLQDLVMQVEVPPLVAEGLEQLADTLERELLTQVVKLPDYVPTKYFSQRSMVKALWALKAAVVRDRIYRRPERRLVADLGDLETLRYFFLLGGPPGAELDVLLKSAADPRERAQLEIIRVENRAFEDAMKSLTGSLEKASEREAAELQTRDDAASAEAQLRLWAPSVAGALARSLREKLVPGPRHPENRAPLMRAAEHLLVGLEARLAKGAGSLGEERVPLLASMLEVFELARRVPELDARAPALARALIDFCRQSAQMVALGAEASEFEENLRLDGVATLAAGLSEELTKVIELLQTVSSLEPQAAEPVRAELTQVRERVGVALRRRAARTFEQPKTGKRTPDALEQLSLDSRRLRELERSLAELSPRHQGLRAELLTPLGEAYAKEALAAAQFTRLDQLTRALQPVVDNLRREGASVEAGVRTVRGPIETRVREYVKGIQAPRSTSADANQILNGEAYTVYRQTLSANAPDGEVKALDGLCALLVEAGSPALPSELREQLATAEIASIITRVRYLRTWLSQLLSALPDPRELKHKVDADRAFDALVKSRFPLLVTKEGEFVRLETSLRRLTGEPGERGEAVLKLEQTMRALAEDFMGFAKQLLDARTAR